MSTHARSFAGFTSSSAFRYSATSIVRLTRFQATPFQPGLFSAGNGAVGIVDVERPRGSTTVCKGIGFAFIESRPVRVADLRRRETSKVHRT